MIVALLTLLTALVALLVGAGAYRHRPDPLALPVVLLMGAVFVWATPHAISMIHGEPSWVLFWTYLQYPGIVAAPLLYLVFALRYAGLDRWVTPRTVGILAVVPVVSLALIWTNSIHGLVWTSTTVETVLGVAVLVTENGTWFWIHLGYLYSLTGIALAILAYTTYARGHAYRTQDVLVFFAGAIPFGVNIAVNTGTSPIAQLDVTPLALAVAGVLFALALFRFDLIDVAALAHQDLIQQLDDGIVIVDQDGKVQDYNRRASELLGEIDAGMPLQEVLDFGLQADGGLVTLDRGHGLPRFFQPRETPLTDDRGNEVGRVVYLTDVTDIVRREQRLSVLNRVLRHNVRNELTVAFGTLELIDEEIQPEHQGLLDRVRDSLDQVLAFSEKARLLEERLDERGETVAVDVHDVLDRVVDQCRTQYPECEITIVDRAREGPDPLRIEVLDEMLLLESLKEVIGNAIEHNDSDVPTVEISVDATDSTVEVRIVDDGPGIPSSERQVLETVRESDLEHGSGLGLWFVHWTVSLSDGTLRIEDRAPTGTRVVLRLQRPG